MSATGRILIVDDNEDNVVYMSQILLHYGYEFTVARNGAEALAVLKDDPPALVLLDIMMPKHSGVSVFKQMKADPLLENIPVVFVSGASSVTGVDMKTGMQRPKTSYVDDFVRGFGAVLSDTVQELTPDGYVEKPIHPPTLAATVKELLE